MTCSLASNKIFYFHALIKLTENIKQALDDGYIGRRIFVDLQKAFDILGDEILLSKLDYYRIRGISNKWFKCYLSNCRQFVSINGYYSGIAEKIMLFPSVLF